MSYNFFALMGRMKYIDRWGLMRNTQVENIQEHSHMVAVLAHALAVIGREKFGGRVDPGEAAVAGLYHDASEILTGDLPTPVKYDNPAIKEAYKAVERVAADKLSAHIKCLEELKAGNDEFRLAAQQTRRALEDIDLPALDYFMEQFLPGFELTLDELQ